MKKRNARPVRWQGKTVGRVAGQTFVKNVVRARHLLRAVGGYAIQAPILEDLHARGVREVRVHEMDTGNVYWTTLETFRTKGKRVNFGHGPQVALPLEHWQCERSAQLSLL
ncbi:hypothetical protein GCM10010885_10410 [Alicyclobacillus cellulosilyticus]|uniref:Uncharacterized protein n=1 Tax=Alicyclobacillus cellulosilyticus TaxID=1003997 RepID=A0A917NI67_9BACL|nr:hypothetical protein GCM10010885_10410 [Alicyclobacillus cellulosilyticus]